MAACTCVDRLLAAGVRNEVVERHRDRLVHPGRPCVDTIVANVSYVHDTEADAALKKYGQRLYELPAVEEMMLYGLDRATCEVLIGINDKVNAMFPDTQHDSAHNLVSGYLRHRTGHEKYAEKRSKWAYHACRNDQGFFVPAKEDRAREIEEDNRRLGIRAQQH